MKTKTPPAGRSKKAASAPAAAPADNQTPINITTDEGKQLRECAAKTGQTIAQFVRKAVVERLSKLTDDALTAIPCPFCKQTDMLEITAWTSERKDGTEYTGDAVKCHGCEAIAPVEAWARLGTAVDQMGGAA